MKYKTGDVVTFNNKVLPREWRNKQGTVKSNRNGHIQIYVGDQLATVVHCCDKDLCDAKNRNGANT